MNSKREGNDSWKGYSFPSGYQRKCPIPSEANSSPSFQAVRFSVFPPHSFLNMRDPIFSSSPGGTVTHA